MDEPKSANVFTYGKKDNSKQFNQNGIGKNHRPASNIAHTVKGLSYPGSLVLDFFAGSGTTGRICIEESRNSILVDSDPKMLEYFDLHLKNMNGSLFSAQHCIKTNPDLNEFLELVKTEIEIEG